MNKETKYAGFWLRFLSTIIDTIWMYGGVYTILWVLEGPETFGLNSSYSVTRIIIEWIIPSIIVIAFWVWKSATPGKMILKMKIVDAETHKKVSIQHLILRYVSYFISTIPFCLGFAWVAWDKKKQGWHDKIAKTVIVRS